MTLLEIYLGSAEIRKQMIRRSNELGIPFRSICNKIGVDYDQFLKRYLNCHGVSKMKISQKNFEEIMGYLGMFPRVNIVLKEVDVVETKKKLNGEQGPIEGVQGIDNIAE